MIKVVLSEILVDSAQRGGRRAGPHTACPGPLHKAAREGIWKIQTEEGRATCVREAGEEKPSKSTRNCFVAVAKDQQHSQVDEEQGRPERNVAQGANVLLLPERQEIFLQILFVCKIHGSGFYFNLQ